MSKLHYLSKPGRIGALELKNRFVAAPIYTRTADMEGFLKPRTKDYYAEMARGGVSIIICQSAAILCESRTPYRPGAWHDKFIPYLMSIADVIHLNGAKAAFQILHHGRLLTALRNGMPRPDEIDPVAPSAIPWGLKKEIPREATKKDINLIIDGFAEAARRIRDAGFDAIEVNGAHDCLIGQFLSPRTNRRNDEYGGSIINRSRFACEIIKAVRKKTGSKYPIIFRMSSSEYIRGGITVDDAIIQAQLFEKAGADALEISGGSVDTAYVTNPCYLMPDALFSDHSFKIKNNVQIPVIVVGKIGEPELAEKLLKDNKADFISMGRALIADPELPKKAISGNLNQVRNCLYCNNCWDSVEHPTFINRGISCTVNPALLREREFILKKAKNPKRILIVGGGLAGMEAGRVLAKRGHKVILCEKKNLLGGQWNIASQMPGKERYARLTRQMHDELNQMSVDIKLGIDVDINLIDALKPDSLIIATGAVPFYPPIPGIRNANVYQADDVISNKVKVGDKVIIVGDGKTAMETSVLLAHSKKHVSLVTRTELGRKTNRYIAAVLKSEMVKHDVFVYPFSILEEIHDDGIYIMTGRDNLFLEMDTLVLATGLSPEKKLFEELSVSRFNIPLFTIGDCVARRGAMEAIREGSEVARNIE